jgi:N-methylhydantoinase A
MSEAVNKAKARLAVDIGGTFTDVALERPGANTVTIKVLTTPAAPERGVLDGVRQVLAEAQMAASEIGLFIHGTTLATNALIERRGARTALIVTEGHRDSLEMAQENRFAQYDIMAERPQPLVPRHLRLPVRERIDWRGDILLGLDEATVAAVIPELESKAVESLAIGLIHAYANPAHERRVADIIAAALPDLSISLSSSVSPEIREYERQSTTVANAYVRPMMARYLKALDTELRQLGLACPFYLMTSGGGLTTVDVAAEYPIRLVESGPAGGAILASRIARECSLDEVVSFDMGGTTAKICLIDGGAPQLSRFFEVDRTYRFMKGSGLPIKIPVIEMVEIGTGGGSIASVDGVKRLTVGPRSAGADPGPACYGRGGDEPTVTDADAVMGRIDPAHFAGGSVALDVAAAGEAVTEQIAQPLGIDAIEGAFGIAEMAGEAMANAARVHAVERGKDIAQRTMIAFGGAAPLHAARLAEKLEIDRVIVPSGAGVGSALGFLSAPVGFEVVRSRYMRLDAFDPEALNDLFAEMRAEAEAIVRGAVPTGDLVEQRTAAMRYVGQGHEITVDLASGKFNAAYKTDLREAFAQTYNALYGRSVAHLDVEVLVWSLTLSHPVAPPQPVGEVDPDGVPAVAPSTRELYDPATRQWVEAGVFARNDLSVGARVTGPALVVEDQTTTIVPSGMFMLVNGLGYLDLRRQVTGAKS